MSEFDPVAYLRLSVYFKGQRWTLRDKDGTPFDLTDLEEEDRWKLINAINLRMVTGPAVPVWKRSTLRSLPPGTGSRPAGW